MFTTGHIIFILICAVSVLLGCMYCIKKKPPIKKVLMVCLVCGILSELIKVLGYTQIVPIVKPEVINGVLTYVQTGEYTPYIYPEHYPFELCTYQILFIMIALVMKDGVWKKRWYAMMYTTCIAGAFMAIMFNAAIADFTSINEFIFDMQIWRNFIYHSMLIVLGIYIGVSEECDIRFKDLMWTIGFIVILDILTMYINAMAAEPYYVGSDLAGIGRMTNYFSSFRNPLGIIMSTKTHWYIYLLIRAVAALVLMLLINLPLLIREKRNG